MNSRKPILVTGSHRSGSTWVGRMIAECPKVVYIHEPFNVQHHDPGICGAKFKYWFTYVKQDIINQAALLWKIIHYMILKYRAEHRDWIFIRHEDLSQDPLYCFRILFGRLNLEFSQQIANVIREHSYASTATEPVSTHSIRRDSRSNILNWKKILTENEIKRIRTQVEEISSEFYTDQDW